MAEYPFPVFHTQGGGLARQDGDRYIFVEAPEPGVRLGIGDEVPEEWGLAPANNAASYLMSPELDPAYLHAEIMAAFDTSLDPRDPSAVERYLSGEELGDVRDPFDPDDQPPAIYEDWVHGGNYEHG